MRLKISAFFDVGTWDRKYLLKGESTGWFKATMTDQGLDRCGDSYWFSGIHIGTGQLDASEKSTSLNNTFRYLSKPISDIPSSFIDGEYIVWERTLEYRIENEKVPEIREVSASWDDDSKTSVALAPLPTRIIAGDNDDLVIRVKLVVKQSSTYQAKGSVDFGASIHDYVIKPCFFNRFEDFFIGSPLSQKDGRVYSGDIPVDLSIEPEGSIDSNLAIYESYTFESRSRKFSNFFTLSSPNSYTKTATSHTIGIPSAYGVEFTPPIDKSFNRELTLNYVIKWERDNG